MRVALRVEVNSLRGLREGVPNLMRLFHEFQIRATFFFPFGCDDAGRSPLQAWRERRILGWKPLLYGTLLRSPSFVEEGIDLMRAARSNGHEVGLFGRSPRMWRGLAHAPEAWVSAECDALWTDAARFIGDESVPLATPAWQTSPALLCDLGSRPCTYTSMSRGKFPYLPSLLGERSPVAEIPTTLPTIREMLRAADVTEANVHEYLYAESRHVLPAGHVYTLTAEDEGLALLPMMEKVLVMWKGQEGAVRALGDVLKEVRVETLPVHQLGWDQRDGVAYPLATQSIEVPR